MAHKSLVALSCMAILGLSGWCVAQTTLDGTLANPSTFDDRLDFNPAPEQPVLVASSGAKLIPLADAVKEFNEKASKNPNGAKQPPLTEDEVVAAIRSWDTEQYKVDNDIHAVYQLIASRGKIPETATLDSLSEFVANGFRFDVWQIVLEVRDGNKGYRYPIRLRMLNSRPVDNGRDDRLEIQK